MTHHSCNHFWRPLLTDFFHTKNWQDYFFQFLLVVRIVLCVNKDAWLGVMLRVSVQVSLLLVGLLNMGRTSFLDAGLRLCQARFSSFRSSEIQRVILVMICVRIWAYEYHPRTDSSFGNHNIGYVFSIFRWWNCNFTSMLIKNFHNLNFNNCSNNCSSRNCCKDSGLWLHSRKRLFFSA